MGVVLKNKMRKAGSVAVLAALLAVMALVMAACGSDDPTAMPTSAPEPTATPVPPPTATPTPLPPGVTPPPPPPPTPTPVAPTATPTPAPTPTPALDWSDQTIKILVGVSPGGGYDAFARLLSRFVVRYLPGQPNFVIQNLPGGGQERSLQGLLKEPADGLTVATMHPRWFIRPILGVEVNNWGVEQMRQATILGGPSGGNASGGEVHIRQEVARTWDEVLALGRDITFGASIPGGTGSVGAEWAALLGAPIKIVYGYGGSSERAAAISRGEIDTDTLGQRTVTNLYPEWLGANFIAQLLWWGSPEPSQAWLDSIGSPFPTHVFDIVSSTEEQRNVMNIVDSFGDFSRAYMLAPGTPENIAKVWVDAYRAVFEDENLKQAVEAAGAPLDFVGYVDPSVLTGALDLVADLSPEGLDFMKVLGGEAP